MYKSQELELTRAVPINIGRQGETGARSVQFDVSSLVSGYSGYELVLAQQRSRDTDAYNIESTLSGNTLTWNVDDYDTFYSGIGRIEIRLIKDGVVVKSAIAYTYCEPSLTGNGTAPSAPPTWYNKLVNDVEEALQASAYAVDSVHSITVQAETLPSESEATAVIDEDMHITFGIPRGKDGGISDVQVAGTSVVADGVANIPVANANTVGVMSVDTGVFSIKSGNKLSILASTTDSIANRYGRILTAKDINDSVTAALTDAKRIALTAEQQATAQQVLGFVTLTQEEYDLLPVKGANTIYLIVG